MNDYYEMWNTLKEYVNHLDSNTFDWEAGRVLTLILEKFDELEGTSKYEDDWYY